VEEGTFNFKGLEHLIAGDKAADPRVGKGADKKDDDDANFDIDV
jgi:hypothetical protein